MIVGCLIIWVQERLVGSEFFGLYRVAGRRNLKARCCSFCGTAIAKYTLEMIQEGADVYLKFLFLALALVW